MLPHSFPDGVKTKNKHTHSYILVLIFNILVVRWGLRTNLSEQYDKKKLLLIVIFVSD